MALYAWAFEINNKRNNWLRVLFPLAILAVSGWELSFMRVRLYPAAVLMPVISFRWNTRSVAWAEVMTASLVGGLVCWKAADAWPLIPGITSSCAMLLLASVVVICRERRDRLLAAVLGSLFYELFFCLKEYMLFSFCIIRIGSAQSLDLCSTTVCLCLVLETIWSAMRSGRTRFADRNLA